MSLSMTLCTTSNGSPVEHEVLVSESSGEMMLREDMSHKISVGERLGEIGDNSFLQDFRTRILSSRRAMSRSMILRVTVTSNGSPAKHEVLVSKSSGEKTIRFLIEYSKVGNKKTHTLSHVILFYSTTKNRKVEKSQL